MESYICFTEYSFRVGIGKDIIVLVSGTSVLRISGTKSRIFLLAVLGKKVVLFPGRV